MPDRHSSRQPWWPDHEAQCSQPQTQAQKRESKREVKRSHKAWHHCTLLPTRLYLQKLQNLPPTGTQGPNTWGYEGGTSSFKLHTLWYTVWRLSSDQCLDDRGLYWKVGTEGRYWIKLCSPSPKWWWQITLHDEVMCTSYISLFLTGMHVCPTCANGFPIPCKILILSVLQ